MQCICEKLHVLALMVSHVHTIIKIFPKDCYTIISSVWIMKTGIENCNYLSNCFTGINCGMTLRKNYDVKAGVRLAKLEYIRGGDW